MLLALLSGFALSQSYRTITAIVAQGLQQDFGLSAQALGAFAGLFGLSFGVAQLLMGITMDRYGLRPTVLASAPVSIAGAICSTATIIGMLSRIADISPTRMLALVAPRPP